MKAHQLKPGTLFAFTDEGERHILPDGPYVSLADEARAFHPKTWKLIIYSSNANVRVVGQAYINNEVKRIQLIVLPTKFAKELREANQHVPEVGEIGTLTDIELGGGLLVTMWQITFDNGDNCWLPKFCFRSI